MLSSSFFFLFFTISISIFFSNNTNAEVCSKCAENPNYENIPKVTCASTCEFLNENDILPYFIDIYDNQCQGDYLGCKSFKSLIQPLGLKNMVVNEGVCSCVGTGAGNVLNFPRTCRKACRSLKRTLTPGVKVENLQCSSSFKIECQVYDKFVRPWGFENMKLLDGKCVC